MSPLNTEETRQSWPTIVDAGHCVHRRPRDSDIPDELKVELSRAARRSLYRNDIDPCALPAMGGRNATLN
jgi:hypothetical protein